MKIGSTLIVGAGGIGSHLAEPLARLLKAHRNGALRMTIVDGDIYEEKNLERQMFHTSHIGKHKSLALAEQVQDCVLFDDSDEDISAVVGYVNSSEDAAGLMLRTYNPEEPMLVCLCVDNDATRRLFYDAIELLPKKHPIVVMIDCGNDLETATVVASFWAGRKSQLVNPVEMYENLKNPKDRVPGGGCQALAPSTPQLMVANMAAAFSAMLLIQALLDGAKFTDVVQSNIRTFSVGVAGGEYAPAQA